MSANPLEISSWESFLHEHIVRLNAFSKTIYDIIEQAQKFNNKSYADLNGFFKEALIAGLKGNGMYSENALAKFFEDIIGISFEDPKLYVELLRNEETRNRAEIDSKIKIERTAFSTLVRIIYELTEVILEKAKNSGFNLEKKHVEIKKPEDLVYITKEFLELAINTTINRNKFALFAWTLRKITKRYLEKAYPSIDKNLLNFLGVRQLRKFKNEKYSIYGYPDYFSEYRYQVNPEGGSIHANGIIHISEYRYFLSYGDPKTVGGSLCRLTDTIFTFLKHKNFTLNKWFRGIPNEEQRYMERALKSLEEAGWKEPEYLKEIYSNLERLRTGYLGFSSGSPFKFLVVEENGIIRYYKQWVYRRSYRNSGIEMHKFNEYLNLYSLLDTISPALFLGVFDMAFGEDGTILLVKRE